MTTLTSSTVADWAIRAVALADELAAAGKLTSLTWRAAVETVPRHVFVPSFHVRRDGRMVAVAVSDAATSDEWLEQVYSNTALITKIGTGEPGEPPVFLSSSSTPGLMTRMLEALDVRERHRVLEIGTGTGYNAALLCHRLGEARVFSSTSNPTSWMRPDSAGQLDYHRSWSPQTVQPASEHAPFDRIIATCSVPASPGPGSSKPNRR